MPADVIMPALGMAQETGKVVRWLKQDGEVEAVAAAPPSAAASPERPRRRLASPKARRLAEEQGVDLDTLAGSGPNGAIVARDLEALHQVVTGNRDEVFAVGSVWRVMADRTTRTCQEVP